MPEITLAQAEAQLTAWLTASTKVASGQSYAVGGRTITRADAREIRENIKFWNDMVKSLNGKGMRITGVTPCV